MQKLKSFGRITYRSLYDTIHHDGVEHAGYIAFLSVLSVFPFLVFFFAAAGFIGTTEIGTRFITLILNNDVLPNDVMDALKPRIQEIISGPPQGLLTLSIVGAIWTSSSMVEGLRTILNRAYRVEAPPPYIFRRLLSVGQFLILTAAITLVAFLFVIAPNVWKQLQMIMSPELWSQIQALIAVIVPDNTSAKTLQPDWSILRYTITILVTLISVIITYLMIPNIKLTWKNVTPGALFVTVLWIISGILFSVYLSNFQQVHVIYGSLGGIIAALLFFYICAMIYVFGAEFNYHLLEARGTKIEKK